MATKLECSVGAIIRDLENIEWTLMATLDSGQANRILNETMSELDAIKSIAFAGLEKADGNTLAFSV